MILRRFEVAFWCLQWECYTFWKTDGNSFKSTNTYTMALTVPMIHGLFITKLFVLPLQCQGSQIMNLRNLIFLRSLTFSPESACHWSQWRSSCLNQCLSQIVWWSPSLFHHCQTRTKDIRRAIRQSINYGAFLIFFFFFIILILQSMRENKCGNTTTTNNIWHLYPPIKMLKVPVLLGRQPKGAQCTWRKKFLPGTHLHHVGREKLLWINCLV